MRREVRDSILDPAPFWRPKRSEFIFLWHGCTLLEREEIEQRGIDLLKCAPNTDFGRGFYTTTLEHQAQQWAWRKFYRWQSTGNKGSVNKPVVLRFELRRFSHEEQVGLDRLTSLHFVLGDRSNDDYWSFVQHCRRSTPRDIRDHKCGPSGWYDMVSGPTAAFWQQRVAMTGADQVSFHSEKAIDLLNAALSKSSGSSYRWFSV